MIELWQNPPIDDSGPLQINILSDQHFSAVLPCPVDMAEKMTEWVIDLLNYPPRPWPGGEVKACWYRETAAIYLVYAALFEAIEPPPFRWYHTLYYLFLDPWGWPPKTEWIHWPPGLAANHLEESWLTEWAGLIPPDLPPQTPPAGGEYRSVVAAPVPAGPLNLEQMAAALELSAAELERRIRTGWTYRVTKKTDKIEEVTRTVNDQTVPTGEFLYAVQYEFGPADAKWNLDNKDNKRKIHPPPVRRTPPVAAKDEE